MRSATRGEVPAPKDCTSCTVALVTNQFDCERIIEYGRAVADITNSRLNVINIDNNRYAPNPLAIEHLFGVSRRNNALMTVVYSEDVYKALNGILKSHKPVSVVSGLPSGKDSVLHRIWRKFVRINFFTVDMDGRLKQITPQEGSITA